MSSEPVIPPESPRRFPWLRHFTWQNASRLAGYLILLVELRQVLVDKPVDTGLVVLAGGLLGVAAGFRKNGNSS